MYYYLQSKIVAFTSTRELNNMPLSFRTHDINHQEFEQNSTRLSETLSSNPLTMVFAHQTHSANIGYANSGSTNFFEDTDGLISDQKGVCLCIRTADCTPVIIYDEINEVIGVVHAGWKGTALNISGKLAQMMINEFDCKADRLKAIIGPCISESVYEVGPDVYQAFSDLPIQHKTLFTPVSDDKFMLDLKGTHQQLLQYEGIRSQNIITSPFCTWQNNDQFYSARKNGFSTGRFVTGIFIQP